MFCNDYVYLYLKSLNYQKKVYSCAKFETKRNTLTEMGNQLSNVITVYIPLDQFNGEDIIIDASNDYALFSNYQYVPTAKVDDKGNIINASELLEFGANIITVASKKNYGSKNMQHWYIEVSK